MVWSESETYWGNLCFVDDQPCSVTALWPVAYQQLAPELEGTGFETGKADGGAGNIIDVEGGSTGWYQVTGSAEPGETLRLTFALFDLGNGGFDSVVLIDNFRWSCEGCAFSEVDGCGVGPM